MFQNIVMLYISKVPNEKFVLTSPLEKMGAFSEWKEICQHQVANYFLFKREEEFLEKEKKKDSELMKFCIGTLYGEMVKSNHILPIVLSA